MNSPSRSCPAASGAQQPALPASAAPLVSCDLCELPMAFPDHIKPGEPILGLLVCTACIEDNLYASADDARSEVGLVGGGH